MDGSIPPPILAAMRAAIAAGASDLHLSADQPPALRVGGRLRVLPVPPPGQDALAARSASVAEERHVRALARQGHADVGVDVPGVGRFRVHLYRQGGLLAAALRVIPPSPPSADALDIPRPLLRLLDRPSGLIVVAGPAASGKSTTLASLVARLSRERDLHIVTLEDPVEFVFPRGRALIHQREVGRDAASFSAGLRAAWRENADVIVVGEVGDPQTVRVAVAAAESGHLVLASLLSSPSVEQALRQLVAAFLPHLEHLGRLQLAGSLLAVLAQVLVPRADGRGEAAAFELLVATPAVRALIRESRLPQIPNTIQTGGDQGMVSLAASLRRLRAAGLIAAEDCCRLAEACCPDPGEP